MGTVYEVTPDGVINLINGVQIDPHVATANTGKLYFGDTGGDDGSIYANSADEFPRIDMLGGTVMYIRVSATRSVNIAEGASSWIVFDRSATSIITDATSQTAWDFDVDTVTTGIGVLTQLAGLQSGYGIKIIADSDVVTTGRPWAYLGGPSKDYEIKWMNLWGRPDFEDDFVGTAINTFTWSPVAAAGGVIAMVTDGDGGQYRLSTGGATGGNGTLIMGNNNYSSDKHCIVEWLVYISDVSEADIYLGFFKDADEYAYFHLDNGTVMLKADDAGVHTYSADSGETVSDNTWYLFRVEVDATETPVFYMDTVVLGTPTAGSVTADNMSPYAYVINTTDNNVNLDLDWCKVWMDR